MNATFALHYYCNGYSGDSLVKQRLEEIETKWGLEREVVDLSRNGEHDFDLNRYVYERDFKPRAKILKRRTGESIRVLRSRSGRYYVSSPGALTVVRDGLIEWFCIEPPKMLSMLDAVVSEGPAAIERLMLNGQPSLSHM